MSRDEQGKMSLEFSLLTFLTAKKKEKKSRFFFLLLFLKAFFLLSSFSPDIPFLFLYISFFLYFYILYF